MNTFFNSSAGTGKTYRLTDKYKKLILENNIDPHEILLMTFTKNAAAELKSEVIKKISNEILEFDTIKEDKQRYLMQRVYSAPICTMDAYCKDILQENAIDAGISPTFQLAENDEYQEILDELSHQEMLEYISKDKYFFQFCSGMLLNSSGKFSESSIPKTAKKIINEASSMGLLFDDDAELLPYPEKVTIEDFKLLSHEYSKKKNGESTEYIRIRINKFLESSLNLSDFLNQITKEKFNPKKNTKIAKSFHELINKAKYKEYYPYFNSFNNYIKSIFKSAEDYKFKRNILTFDDIKYHAIKIINNKIYQPKFKYLIIDEVQDTSVIQYQLIKSLWKKNVTIITCGDSKQSIYSWRNADSEIMNIIHDEIKSLGGNITPLQKSYRTKKTLILTINKIFRNAKFHETTISKYLRKNVCFPNYNNEELISNTEINADEDDSDSIECLLPEEVLISDNKSDLISKEMTALAKRISLLVRSNDKKWTPKYRYHENKFNLTNKNNKYQFSDILILLRKQTNLSILQEALKKENIPYAFEGKGHGLFSSVAAKDLSLLLNVIYDPRDEYSLIGLLRSPWFCLSDEEITQKLINKKDRIMISLFPEISNQIQYYKDRISLRLVSEICRECIEKFHYDNFLSSLPDGDYQLANLRKLIDWIRKKERNINHSSHDVVRKLKKYIETPPKLNEATLNDINLNAVKIMTIHSSKGLTERVVCIPELSSRPTSNKSFAFLGKSNNKLFLNINLTMMDKSQIKTCDYADAERIKKDIQARENINLFYVAMTRARDLIILSSTQKISEEPKSWMKHIHNYLSNNIKVIHYNQLRNIESEVKKIHSSKISSAQLRKKIDSQNLNFKKQYFERLTTTSLAKKINSKIYSAENNKLKNIGILGHLILELAAQAKWNIDVEKEIINLFKQYDLNYSDVKNLKEKLINVIKIMKKETSGSKNLITEYPFLLKENDKLIDGIIDLISITDNKITIFDYKFSNKSDEILKEEYKNQLDIYLRAVNYKFMNYSDIRTYLVSISDEDSRLIKLPIISS